MRESNAGQDQVPEPAISVIITAYNRRALLPRAIESLRRQTVSTWEAVVVDDGSRDGTRELVADYMARDPRIRYIHQENSGLSTARNTGLRAARAPLMTFLDSDDEYHPRHLEVRLRFFAEHPEVELVHGGLEVVGGPDWVPDRFDPTRKILLADCFVGGTFVMRRHVFEKLGGFRKPDYGDDYDFMTRALELNIRVVRLDEPTYIYHRETPDGMCNLMAAEKGTDRT